MFVCRIWEKHACVYTYMYALVPKSKLYKGFICLFVLLESYCAYVIKKCVGHKGSSSCKHLTLQGVSGTIIDKVIKKSYDMMRL